MDIWLDAYVHEDEKVTLQFDALPLKQVIKHLSDSYALFHDERSGKLSRIPVYPGGEEPSRFLSELEKTQCPYVSSSAKTTPDRK